MKMPLKVWIVIVTTISMLITLSVIFATEYYVNRQSLTEVTLQQNYAEARKMSALTNDTFVLIQDTLNAHHKQIVRNWDNPEALQEISKMISAANFNLNSVTIIEADGTGRANYPELNLVGRFVDTEGVIEGIKMQRDFISSPYVGTNGKLMLIVSTAIYDDGKYYGMLNGLVWLQEQNFLTRLLEQNFGDNHVFFAVYDSEGNYIYHPNEDWIGTKAHENQATLDLEEGKSGMGIIEDRLGNTFYAGYSGVPSSEWSIITMTPEEAALEPATLSTNRALLMVTPFVLIAFLLLLGLILFITRPLHRLSRVDYSKPISELVAETQELRAPYREAESIKQMILSFAQSQHKLMANLESIAITDPLTGLSNRRQFSHMVEMIKENEESFGFVLIDLDRFKSVNDTYGHLMGDQVLIKLAEVIKSLAPSASLPVRLGGEEFGILIQDTSSEGVIAFAERLRREIEHTEFPVPRKITASMGVGYLECNECDLNIFFNEVDRQLYKAKENGRNRIETVTFVNGVKQFS